MGAGDYIEIHDDFFVFKQGRKSPRKVYWKEISGLAFSGNKHFLPFSVMNVFEETGNMEPQTIVLLDSTYEQYKKMWEDMILSYTKSQPESHNIDAKFGEFLSLWKIYNIIEWYLVNLAYRDFQQIQIQKLRIF